jgi:hypothetical protein
MNDERRPQGGARITSRRRHPNRTRRRWNGVEAASVHMLARVRRREAKTAA